MLSCQNIIYANSAYFMLQREGVAKNLAHLHIGRWRPVKDKINSRYLMIPFSDHYLTYLGINKV